MDHRIQAFTQFLDRCHSVYHSIAALTSHLDSAGYAKLPQNTPWELVPGGKYYLTRGGSALIAFRVPVAAPTGFLMSASHADYPGFQLRDNFELTGTYIRLSTEKYGGPLMAPWMDRPLSVAGRVTVKTAGGIESRLVDIDRDLLLIPNVAIHMQRNANEGVAINPAVDTLPVIGGPDAAGKLAALLQEAAGGEILAHDLYLYVRQKAAVWGIDEEYISAQGLDDLQCAWCCVQGFLQANEISAMPVLCVFDNEETGSSTNEGADSDLLETTLRQICAGLQLDLPAMLSQSFMVSADNAHAIHPNHPEFSDANHAPRIGGGAAIKFNASKYSTDGTAAAVWRSICQKAGVPLQSYCNRADLPGGSTLGNISLSHVSVPTVDLGLPQLAMHSCYETAGVKDVLTFTDAMTAYYSTSLTLTDDGSYNIK